MKIHPLGNITADEKALVSAAIPELATNIKTVCNLTFPLSRIQTDVHKLQGSKYVLDKYKEEEEEGPSKL